MTASNTTYLLVEDDCDYADLVRMSLGRINPTALVERVEDGEAAITYLGDLLGQPDAIARLLILLDLNLPKVNGHEVLQYIKADEQLRKIPTILLTSSSADEDRARAYDLHVNSVLTKPGDFRDLQEMLGALDQFWTKWNRVSRAA